MSLTKSSLSESDHGMERNETIRFRNYTRGWCV